MCISLRVCPGMGFPNSSVAKNPPANAGDARDGGLISGLRRYPGGRNGNPLWYSCLENPMDRGVWWATVHGDTRVRPNLAAKLVRRGQFTLGKKMHVKS